MGKIENQRDRALLAVIAGSGIRNGEACTMLRNRLDLEGKRFYVTGKGNKERVCFLTPRAKYELKKYLNMRTDDSPYVFVSLNKNHSQIHTHCIEAVLRKAGEKVGIHAYPHKLRHFFADNAHEAGIDVLDISRMLGHESVSTTEIYTHIDTTTWHTKTVKLIRKNILVKLNTIILKLEKVNKLNLVSLVSQQVNYHHGHQILIDIHNGKKLLLHLLIHFWKL